MAIRRRQSRKHPSFLPVPPIDNWDILRQEAAPSSGLQLQAARQSDCPVHIVRSLAMSQDVQIRRIVALRNALTEDLWAQLAYDRDIRVRIAIASNPACPSNLLIALGQEPFVMETVARNPNTPEEALWPAIRSLNRDCRCRAALHINCPLEAMIELAQDEDRLIRDIIYDRSDLPEFIRAVLALAR